MAQAGAPLTFRVPSVNLKLAVQFGCMGAAAMSGRYDGIVTPSNALICGNKSNWWGFTGRENVDGTLRSFAGPGLAEECDSLPALAHDAEDKLRPAMARATSGHGLNVRHVLHAFAPSSAYPRQPAELALRRTYANCLELSARLGVGGLALPALGCGVAGFPSKVGARAAFDAIDDAVSIGLWSASDGEVHGDVDGEGGTAKGASRATTAPARLTFMLLDEGVYATFADEAHARWGGK